MHRPLSPPGSRGPRGGWLTPGQRGCASCQGRPGGDRWGPRLTAALLFAVAVGSCDSSQGTSPPWTLGPGPAHALLPAASAVTASRSRPQLEGCCAFLSPAWGQPGGFCSCAWGAPGCSPRSLAPRLQGATWEGLTRKQRSWQEQRRTQEATRWTQLGPQASDPQSSRLSPSLEWSPPWASVPCAVWIPNPQDCEQIRPRLGVIYEAAIGNWKKIPCQCKNLIYTYLWWREVTPLEAQMGTPGVPSTGRTTQGSEPAPVVWADKFRRELWSVAFTFPYLLLFLWWQCFSWSRGKAKYR